MKYEGRKIKGNNKVAEHSGAKVWDTTNRGTRKQQRKNNAAYTDVS